MLGRACSMRRHVGTRLELRARSAAPLLTRSGAPFLRSMSVWDQPVVRNRDVSTAQPGSAASYDNYSWQSRPRRRDMRYTPANQLSEDMPDWLSGSTSSRS